MPPDTLPTPNAVAQLPDAAQFRERFLYHLHYTQGKHWDGATLHDQFIAVAMTLRELIMVRKIATQSAYARQDVKRVYYLSLEYLLGQSLRNYLVNLGLLPAAEHAMESLGLSLDEICEYEPDAGLGNGGLGRLAACFMDSLASLELPAYGYGIRYAHGMFEQEIHDGWQVERPDDWLRFDTPWQTARPEFTVPVRLYGRVEPQRDSNGVIRPRWVDFRAVMGVPFDMPMLGYRNNTVNLLRLWSASASEALNLEAFNRGGYVEAVRERVLSETISKVLYPNDNNELGRELRLVQQYFFVACTLSDVLRRYERRNNSLDAFPDKVAIQLNDTHPSVAVAELTRIFVDERGLPWNKAWELVTATFGYTNHTLMPEALEVWPVDMFSRVLPRHIQIIYEINQRFLDGVVARRWPGDVGRMQRLSLIQEQPYKGVRMANLAIVGSHAVNGVARLHTDLLRTRLVPDFAELFPERFSNKTNGVTPRRWLLACNPALAALITHRIGDAWVRDLERLRQLEPHADDPRFQQEVMAVKRLNKQRLGHWVQRRLGLHLSPDALFDVHVKRLHEYKRQLLNILQVVIRAQRILENPDEPVTPRAVLFGAKAAPAYGRAKLIIKLINEVARAVNNDPRIGEKLKVAFLPNYRVSLAEIIIPAADLSEQISTAGMEASGTGNMKFAMNGALTIGTLDGANIEIRDAVGPENFFLFGLTAEQVAQLKPRYDPASLYRANAPVRRALDAITRGAFSPQAPDTFRPVFDWLVRDGDPYMLLADIDDYLAAQQRVDETWRRPADWARKVVLNIARIGSFSSDRTIREYAADIWGIQPLPVELPGANGLQ